ncbi:MAG: hypothetical protein ACI4FN_00030 [Acutalibacteraceae bacterium]
MTSPSISAGSTSGHCIPAYISSSFGCSSTFDSAFSAADDSDDFVVSVGLVSAVGFVAIVGAD